MPPPKPVTLGAFLPAQLKPSEQPPEPVQQTNAQPRPQRCRCEGPFDLCLRYPAAPNAVCKATWDRLLSPVQFKGREWTIVELRSLWPHTIQALNERLVKGRMERTLKEDLQDDLQVLVDLIQYSCKPHPRPPRAGMKTLIVQGRILAEAIAQDALFQLDPSDPAAPRPDRDLVDLINRLRDHHPNSLLAPALHVLRTLGNTAVHLDRDSARLTDAEIGDAAAVCCRFVVLVIDAYMQMCANLHKHEETEEALAQPLQELPAAPLPVPNVLLRPRETATGTAASTVAGEESAVATTAVAAPPPPPPQLLQHAIITPAAAAVAVHAVQHPQPQIQIQQQQPQPPQQQPQPQYMPLGIGSQPRPPPSLSPSPSAPPALQAHAHAPALFERGSGFVGGRTGGISGGGAGDEDDFGGTAAVGTRRDSGGGSGGSGGGRRSCSGSDGAGRVPYSLVTKDWAAPPPHTPLQLSSGGGGGGGSCGGNGSGSPRGQGSRGWWPSAVEAQAPAPSALLRRVTLPEAIGQLTPASVPASSVSDWLHGHPTQYGLPASAWVGNGVGVASASVNFSRRSNGSAGSGGGAADAPAVMAATAVYGRQLSASAAARGGADAAAAASQGHHSTAPYILPPGVHLALSHSGPQTDAWQWQQQQQQHEHQQQQQQAHHHHRSSDHPSGGSPRRSPISLTSPCMDATADSSAANAAAVAAAMAVAAAAGVGVRGSSPKHLHHPYPPHPHVGGSSPPQQRPLAPSTSLGIGPGSSSNGGGGGGAGMGSGPGSGLGSVGPLMTVSEASKRLLQLCATAQAPPVAKVQRLLQAGATLGVSDKSGMTALHMACYWCHGEAAALLLERLPPGGGAAAAAAADREGRTPLWVASQRGHVEVVELLLRATGAGEGAGASSSVSAAAGGGGGAGPLVDVANAAGVTPLRVAAAQGHTQVVAALLQAEARVELADKDGFTPLYVACARSHLEVVRLLLAAGAAVDRADKGQRTPLWAALHPGGSAKAETCPERRAAVVRALLAAGADVHLLPDGRDRDYCWQVLAQSIAAGE